MKEWMMESFEYDLWANRQWIDALLSVSEEHMTGRWATQIEDSGPWPDFPHAPDRSPAILAHILWAQRIWIARCGVTVAPSDPQDLRGWIEPLNESWRRLVDRGDMYERIVYKNTAGVEGRRTLGEIARHVLNHGTHHRGQLRDAAETIPGIAIPNTDLLLFFMRSDRR